jgi:hypothetical protein
MNELFPLFRAGSQPQALHYGYEKAGLIVYDQPIPWNAETVLIEAGLWLPPSTQRRLQDFQARIPGLPPQAAESLRPGETEHRHVVTFRVPPPRASCAAELFFRQRSLGQLTLPRQSEEEFAAGLRVQMPTVFVRLGAETVACRTFVPSQCKGLQATALLTSLTSLIPLVDLPLRAQFQGEWSLTTDQVTVRPTAAQLAGRTALVSVAAPWTRFRIGPLRVDWQLGDKTLASQRLRAISRSTFEKSLRVVDARFVARDRPGDVTTSRQMPPLDKLAGVGPCFVVCSREAGMAAWVDAEVVARTAAPGRSITLFDDRYLLTDGPNLIAPGLIDTARCKDIVAFELYLAGKSAAILPTVPAPQAAFDGEGGFTPATDYTWSPAAEDELNERLSKLFDEQDQ